MGKKIRSFSEGITTGSRQILRITGSTVRETKPAPTPFEKQSKEFIKRFGLLHPDGTTTFIKKFNRGLKYGYNPRELERVFRTWFYNKGIVGDKRQAGILKYVWPELKNKWSDVIKNIGPPWKGVTIYDRGTSAHKEGLHPGTYAEKVSVKRLQAEMNYHPAVGYY